MARKQVRIAGSLESRHCRKANVQSTSGSLRPEFMDLLKTLLRAFSSSDVSALPMFETASIRVDFLSVKKPAANARVVSPFKSSWLQYPAFNPLPLLVVLKGKGLYWR